MNDSGRRSRDVRQAKGRSFEQDPQLKKEHILRYRTIRKSRFHPVNGGVEHIISEGGRLLVNGTYERKACEFGPRAIIHNNVLR